MTGWKVKGQLSPLCLKQSSSIADLSPNLLLSSMVNILWSLLCRQAEATEASVTRLQYLRMIGNFCCIYNNLTEGER